MSTNINNVTQLSKGVKSIVFAACGNSTGGQIISLIDKWLAESGIEWTCKRLKAIRNGLYQLRAGHPGLARTIWQDNSICYHKDTLLPKGPFRTIGWAYLKAQTPVIIRKYDAVLRIYTSLKLNNLSQTQLQKCKKAINDPYKGEDDFLVKMCESVGLETSRLQFKCVKPPKPDISKLKSNTSTHKSVKVSKDILDMPYGKHIASLWSSTYLPKQLISINPAEEFRAELVKSGAENSTAGHIAFIQENGCKARVVAVPNAWIQYLLKPLEDVLSNLIKTLPESCRNDQVDGAYFICKSFEKGEPLWCYDLSSATDRFPLPLQRCVLNRLGYKDYGDAIYEIANAKWTVSVKTDKNQVSEDWSYKTGQPMGMYCSFALFHLTHILLLRSIETELGQTGTFAILGDDVVINNKEVAYKYNDYMGRLNIEISELKSINSDRLAEYAGFVGYKLDNGKVAIHRPFKFSGKPQMGHTLHLVNALGRNVSRINSWYEKAYHLYRNTISDRYPDLTPIVPANKEETLGSTINSHYLGSVSNRLSYELPLDVTEELLNCYEAQQIILLGEKEIMRDGFASKDNNLDVMTPSDLEELSCITQDSTIYSYVVQFSKDPLIRAQIELNKSGDTLASE